jgi:hypothetical protein
MKLQVAVNIIPKVRLPMTSRKMKKKKRIKWSIDKRVLALSTVNMNGQELAVFYGV